MVEDVAGMEDREDEEAGQRWSPIGRDQVRLLYVQIPLLRLGKSVRRRCRIESQGWGLVGRFGVSDRAVRVGCRRWSDRGECMRDK